MVSSLGIKPLKLKEALELYDLIGRFIPEHTLDEQIIDFVGRIVDNIVEDDPVAYINALSIMTGIEMKELAGFSSTYLLELFVSGLTVNDIIGLRRFCKGIQYG